MRTKLVTGYHYTAFDHVTRRSAVDRVLKKLQYFPEDVGIVCTGLSGILVGVPVAEQSDREFAIVRKPNESCNSSYKIEGYTFTNYVIVDDFISGGETIRRVLEVMNDTRPESNCLGILLYDGLSGEFDKRYDYFKKPIPIFSV